MSKELTKKSKRLKSESNPDLYLVKQYIFDKLQPYYVAEEALVRNSKEMLELPWIKIFYKHKQFSRFSISEYPDFKYLLIENSLSTWWWPVAILPKEFYPDLPAYIKILDRKKVSYD